MKCFVISDYSLKKQWPIVQVLILNILDLILLYKEENAAVIYCYQKIKIP